jgi:hypothetical protein
MKLTTLLAILACCGGFYIHAKQPKLWDQLVATATGTVGHSPEKEATEQTFIPPSPLPSHPNWTWTTADGKTYEDVVVKKVEADCVTVMDSDGGARIETATLPADIQQELNYSSSLAAAAHAKREQDDTSSEALLEQERAQAQQVTQQKLVEQDAHDNAIRSGVGSDLARTLEASGGSETGVVVTDEEWAGYQSDLVIAMGHIRINPNTGLAEGDPYYVRKYEEDRRLMDLHDRQHGQPGSGWANNGIPGEHRDGFAGHEMAGDFHRPGGSDPRPDGGEKTPMIAEQRQSPPPERPAPPPSPRPQPPPRPSSPTPSRL